MRSKIFALSSTSTSQENSGRRSWGGEDIRKDIAHVVDPALTLSRNADAKDVKTKWPVKNQPMSDSGTHGARGDG